MAHYGAKGKYPTEEDYLLVPRLTYTPVHQRKAERLAWEEKQAKNKPEKEEAAKEKTSNDGMEAKAKKEKDFKEAKERWEQNAKKQIAEEKAAKKEKELAFKAARKEALRKEEEKAKRDSEAREERRRKINEVEKKAKDATKGAKTEADNSKSVSIGLLAEAHAKQIAQDEQNRKEWDKYYARQETKKRTSAVPGEIPRYSDDHERRRFVENKGRHR